MRWYLQSLPPKRFMIAFAALVSAVGVAGVLVWLTLARSISPHEAELTLAHRALSPFLLAELMLSVVGAIFLGMCRAARIPHSRSDYADWLGRTPWTASQRLPFGPWQPVRVDLIPLGTLGAVSAAFAGMMYFSMFRTLYQTHQDIVAVMLAAFAVPAIAFLLTWIGCCYRLCLRWEWSIFAPVSMIGLLIQTARYAHPVAALVAAGVLLVLGIIAVWRKQRRMLGELPSDGLAKNESTGIRDSSPIYQFLSPIQKKPWLIEMRDRYRTRTIAIGVMVWAWADFTFQFDPYWKDLELMAGLIQLLGVFIVGGTTLVACIGRLQSHLGVSARWATGQWIVPQYDRVWIPLLSIVLLWGSVMVSGYVAEVSNLTTLPFTLAAAAMIGMTTGPDYERWSLTAPVSHLVKRGRQRRA